jgi:imidazolonepropionase-like amidohydrolase
VADVRRSLEISMNNLRRAVRAGVKIAMGTDSGNAS